ncbi:MAG: hypothetical protein IPN76_17555 [Saprospiraceae bacterium]|nr:hypothetical protein [Saprospiraceae bacterium]
MRSIDKLPSRLVGDAGKILFQLFVQEVKEQLHVLPQVVVRRPHELAERPAVFGGEFLEEEEEVR